MFGGDDGPLHACLFYDPGPLAAVQFGGIEDIWIFVSVSPLDVGEGVGAEMDEGVVLHSVPEQLAFVGYGDPTYYRWICGGITTIALSEQQLACEALRMLQDCTSNRAVSSQTIAAELILRHST